MMPNSKLCNSYLHVLQNLLTTSPWSHTKEYWKTCNLTGWSLVGNDRTQDKMNVNPIDAFLSNKAGGL